MSESTQEPTQEPTQEAQAPKAAPKPIVLYSKEPDGVLVPLSIQPPPNVRSSDGLLRWLKKNAEIDGVYSFQRELVSSNVSVSSVKQVVIN